MIISNKVLTARQFAEATTGLYFGHCDTLTELIHCVMPKHIPVNAIALKNFPLLHIENRNYVLVEVSSDEDFTEHNYYFITVQKKYLNKFKKYLSENGLE